MKITVDFNRLNVLSPSEKGYYAVWDGKEVTTAYWDLVKFVDEGEKIEGITHWASEGALGKIVDEEPQLFVLDILAFLKKHHPYPASQHKTTLTINNEGAWTATKLGNEFPFASGNYIFNDFPAPHLIKSQIQSLKDKIKELEKHL